MPKDQLKKCPICGTPTKRSGNIFRPFCSKRCKMIDLGDWATESYRIPGKKVGEDELSKELKKKEGGG